MTTTNTKTVITTGGGDYSTLSAWEADRNANLVTADYIEIANCSGATADTTQVYINEWTTGPSNYIQINGNNNTGKASTNKYRLSYTGGDKFRIYPNYVIVKNIEFIFTDGYIQTLPTGAAVITMDGCIIHGGSVAAINESCGSGQTFNLYNTIIYGFGGYALSQQNTSSVYNFYNNTFYGNGRGINCPGSATKTLKNNLCYSNTINYNIGTTTHANNLSNDDGSPDAAFQNKTVTFVNTGAGVEDFHLVSTDTDAIDHGTDLSAIFTTDINGRTRSGTWDIGADEYIAVAGSASASQIESDSTSIFFI
jgi:hypothetical protein